MKDCHHQISAACMGHVMPGDSVVNVTSTCGSFLVCIDCTVGAIIIINYPAC